MWKNECNAKKKIHFWDTNEISDKAFSYKLMKFFIAFNKKCVFFFFTWITIKLNVDCVLFYAIASYINNFYYA